MATAPIQGLRIALKLADARNPREVLKNLNLELEDLDRIRNIFQEGVDASDIRSLSGLESDIEKEVIAVFNETRTYQNILSDLNDGNRRIGGNLNIAGQLIAPTFKFNVLDESNTINTVDLSTSRASAWSAFGDPSDSVFYGGDVILSGNTASIELSSLEFTEEPKEKRFESQIPTHKIRIFIDGEDYDIYAMKGIPFRFKGFFRTARNLNINLNQLTVSGAVLRPSWIIRNTDGREFVYENVLSGSGSNRQSSISFFDSTAKERTIEFYYRIDRITRIELRDARIFEIPKVIFPNLTSFLFSNNDLVEMPNAAVLYPSLQILDLSGNDLTRSDEETLKTFTPEVVSRLPNTLQTLILDNVYSNACTADLSVLTNLKVFKADSSQTNSRRMIGTSPAIGAALEEYTITGNNFSVIHPSVLESNTLKILNVRSNEITGNLNTTIGANLQNIEVLNTGNDNNHGIIDLSGRLNLRIYNTSNMNFPGNAAARSGTNIFVGCSSLETIRVNNTNITDSLPNFSTNTSLIDFYSWSSQWLDAELDFSIGENTFGTDGGCRNTLSYFNLQSVNLRGPIHPQAFRNMTALRTLVIRSSRRGVTGVYPSSINDCFELRSLNLSSNLITGAIPNFSGNKKLATIDLSYNSFTGVLPSLDLPLLRLLNIRNNNLTGIQMLDCPQLITLQAASNSISSIPDFTLTFRIQEIFLSENLGITYTPGNLVNVTSLRRLELTGCNLNQGAVNNILIDLNTNYNNNPRSNVQINLKGNAAPSTSTEIIGIINRLRREGWTLGLES